ncbi:hypothetical protein OBBRIDRAFT_434855 [Obba rivulosa]|uniref:Uncharacterized protein n=1 Tax=Obba rivulosa TaxID=1052685 RepID=A0A8E2B2K2_9APHY|nr:hypothetical protein OBBRIDRAFT_434855 [Obba rivulosa]
MCLESFCDGLVWRNAPPTTKWSWCLRRLPPSRLAGSCRRTGCGVLGSLRTAGTNQLSHQVLVPLPLLAHLGAPVTAVDTAFPGNISCKIFLLRFLNLSWSDTDARALVLASADPLVLGLLKQLEGSYLL